MGALVRARVSAFFCQVFLTGVKITNRFIWATHRARRGSRSERRKVEVSVVEIMVITTDIDSVKLKSNLFLSPLEKLYIF